MYVDYGFYSTTTLESSQSKGKSQPTNNTIMHIVCALWIPRRTISRGSGASCRRWLEVVSSSGWENGFSFTPIPSLGYRRPQGCTVLKLKTQGESEKEESEEIESEC